MTVQISDLEKMLVNCAGHMPYPVETENEQLSGHFHDQASYSGKC
jgi:hypothetical protein